jgi:hypothetical protein
VTNSTGGGNSIKDTQDLREFLMESKSSKLKVLPNEEEKGVPSQSSSVNYD